MTKIEIKPILLSVVIPEKSHVHSGITRLGKRWHERNGAIHHK